MAIVLLRTLIIYFTLLLIMRLLGKRQLGEMELSEFVLAALIADLASHPLQDMGIPLINSVLGAEGVFYITAYLVVFNFLTWTHGLILITGDASPKQLARGLRSPVMFTMLAGMIFYFFRIHIPANIGSALTYVANMNTPLGMFVAGAALAEAHPLEALKKKQVYLVALAKLIIMPVLAAAVMLPFHPADVVYYTVVAAAASPVATTCTMMALRYDKNYHYASELYVVTTMMSMLTIPAVMAIAQMLF